MALTDSERPYRYVMVVPRNNGADYKQPFWLEWHMLPMPLSQQTS